MTGRKHGKGMKADAHERTQGFDHNFFDSSQISHGGHNEERKSAVSRFKPGDISWVPPFKSDGVFKSWKFHFELGVQTYLSRRVYDDVEERNGVYALALLKAAEYNEPMQIMC